MAPARTEVKPAGRSDALPPLARGDWFGVMPAITTPFADAGADEIDLEFLARHARWLCDNGCTGVIAAGSLGEGNTLRASERESIWSTLVEAIPPRPVIAAVAASSTAEAVTMAKSAESLGCRGLMILPPYLFRGAWSEIRAHIIAIARATPLGCMLYNNPAMYGIDLMPEQVHELSSEVTNLHAIKESSGDVRRVVAIRALCGSRLAVFVGQDDCLLEGVRMGAEGWSAGFANAMPEESVALFDDAVRGDFGRADTMYRWFLPLLRLIHEPQSIQFVKLVQSKCGMGKEHVRLPRQPITGNLREEGLALIRSVLATRPLGATAKG